MKPKIFGLLIVSILFLLCSSTSKATKKNKTSRTRPQEAMQNAITRETNRLKLVYEDALKRDANIYGKLNVKFIILPDGTVSNISKTLCTISDTLFVNAVIDRIATWKFPAIKNGNPVEIVYPLIFEKATENKQ